MNISVNKKINEFENKKKFWLENVKINKKIVNQIIRKFPHWMNIMDFSKKSILPKNKFFVKQFKHLKVFQIKKIQKFPN